GIPTVVVTHHPAIPAALTPAQAADPCVGADASELTALVAASGAALWVSGHTHWAMDIDVGGTRCVSNPHGRPGEVTGYREGWVLDVDSTARDRSSAQAAPALPVTHLATCQRRTRDEG
ncbi:MAG: hypothetical protein MUF00_20095, partial [Gemmatimonadaceae bacterium]|nr:hypothetical protein [Gemmatimonadaceae bacterium]